MEQKHRFSEPEGTLEMSSLVPSVNKWQGPKKKTNKKNKQFSVTAFTLITAKGGLWRETWVQSLTLSFHSREGSLFTWFWKLFGSQFPRFANR